MKKKHPRRRQHGGGVAFLLRLFPWIKGVIFDLDDVITKSEELQKLAWKLIVHILCAGREGNGTRARQYIPEKEKMVDQFFDKIFDLGGGEFRVMLPGLLFLLAEFRWLPDPVFAIWNKKVPDYARLMSELDQVLLRYGIDILKIPHIQQEARFKRLSSPSPDFKLENEKTYLAASELLDNMLNPERTAMMVATIKAEPKKWLFPGVKTLLMSLMHAGIKIGFCTSGHRNSSLLMLEAALGVQFVAKVFPVKYRVYGNDVTRKKPHPEGYQMVAKLFGLKRGEIAVAEDRLPNLINCLDPTMNFGRAFGAGILVVKPDADDQVIQMANQMLERFPHWIVVRSLGALRVS